MVGEAFLSRGWARFGPDPVVKAWADAVLPAARAAMAAPENAGWWRCDGTWFAGVNCLPNDDKGAVEGSVPLGGAVVALLAETHGFGGPWDRAQVSVTRPGYPRRGAEETEAAARYRRDRDAAHVDGLLPVGPERRRHIQEQHGFLLGLPLTEAGPGAAPLVVWEGSHEIMRAAFRATLAGHPVAAWPEIDVTDTYHAARREVFARCRRVELPARPGEATLLHRLALHGVAPWAEGAQADPDGRAIAYFRPEMPGGLGDWLNLP